MVTLNRFLHVSRKFETFYDRVVPGLMDDVTALTLQEFQEQSNSIPLRPLSYMDRRVVILQELSGS